MKEEETSLKEKSKVYIVFIIYSILISIFLLPFVNSMTSKYPDAYPGSEASSGVITSEIANSIAIYIWPILIIYLIMLIVLIAKKVNYRKVYYPLSLFTLTIIVYNLGVIYYGYMIFWYAIISFFPVVALLVTLLIVGWKLDNKTISKKTAGIILSAILLIILAFPMFILVASNL